MACRNLEREQLKALHAYPGTAALGLHLPQGGASIWTLGLPHCMRIAFHYPKSDMRLTACTGSLVNKLFTLDDVLLIVVQQH